MTDTSFPIPTATQITRWSPTTITRLRRCGLAEAFAQDSQWKGLARPTTHSVLGTAAHALAEAAATGGIRPTPPASVEDAVREKWNTLIAIGYERLRTAWLPAEAPPPAAWPSYALVSTRALRRAAQTIGQQPPPVAQVTNAGPGGLALQPATAAERQLSDPETGLYGTPDLVQNKAGYLSVIDLKTGIAQAEPTTEQRTQLALYAHLVRVSRGRLPDECAIIDGAGNKYDVPVSEVDVTQVLQDAAKLVEDFNDAVHGGSIPVQARPSPEACRWCAYRPCCGAYFNARQPDWRGARGDVHGRVEGQETTPDGDSLLRLRASLPTHLEGLEVVVREGPTASTLANQQCSVVDADMLGGPSAQRARWDSRILFFE